MENHVISIFDAFSMKEDMVIGKIENHDISIFHDLSVQICPPLL